jgi:hypothetical protein
MLLLYIFEDVFASVRIFVDPVTIKAVFKQKTNSMVWVR